MSMPQEPTPPVQPVPPVQPALPDLSDFITNPGKPPKQEGAPRSPAARYAVAGIAGLALLGVGFGIGRATTTSGPSTLVAAVQEAQAGKLPCGTPSTSGGTGNAGTFIVARLCGSNGTTGGGFGGGGFGGGTTAGGTGAAGGFRGGAFGGLFGPGAVTGTVTSVSGGALQLQTRAGAVTVQLPSTAKVTKTTAGSLSDVTTGHQVIVTTTTSGSTRTATSIFVLPASTTSS